MHYIWHCEHEFWVGLSTYLFVSCHWVTLCEFIRIKQKQDMPMKP